MPPMLRETVFFLLLLITIATPSEDEFVLNGFSSKDLNLDGTAFINSNGLLELTNNTQSVMGHAFYPNPISFKSSTGKLHSFSTTFVFAIVPEVSSISGEGIAFVVSRTNDFSSVLPNQYFGLFNRSSNGNSTSHIFAVEIDTTENPEFQDINDNHIGVDINSLVSNISHAAGYYDDDDAAGSFRNLSLIGGQPLQIWIDFDGEGMQLNVSLSALRMPKPKKPLLSSTFSQLESLMLMDSMYVGFSSADGPFRTKHYLLGWSFKMNGAAEQLDYAKLPSLPVVKMGGDGGDIRILTWWLPATLCLFVLSIVAATLLIVKKRREAYAELLEDWESEYGPHRFKYKDLFQATNGFKERELLGSGGFGRVYRGVMHTSNIEVAVKKVAHDSKQGIKEFVAEIVSIGQLRHKNIVQLLGYCRRKGELLLVYDLMPNGSLDKFLHNRTDPTTLSWAQRFRIIKGVASGLLYLHENCEQVVIHRDIKASNVLLDSELNGRLGDFGLARLYDRGSDPRTTRVAGTMGYLAPELAMVGKATKMTDVFAFGAFMLEVVCGRRPIEWQRDSEEMVLVDWVLECWRRESLVEAVDPRLREECCICEVELVLKLGLLCSHPLAEARPSMQHVLQILDGETQLPESANFLGFGNVLMQQKIGFDDYIVSFSSSVETLSSISGGR